MSDRFLNFNFIMDYDKLLESLPTSLIGAIARIDELKGRWIGGCDLSPRTVENLRRSTLITSAGASTRIEGSKMTDKDIEDYLSGLKIQKFAERDRQEVSGYHETLELIFNQYQELAWTENNIKYLHTRLLQYSAKDENHRGNYKTIDNRIEAVDANGKLISVIFETTPVYLVGKEMSELIDWSQSAERHHPLLVLSVFTISFLKIHPFLDGNSRLSRLLTNQWLLRHGYDYTPFVSHEKLIEDSKADYSRTLRDSQITFGRADESVGAWTEYFLRILLFQAQKAVDLLDVTRIEDELSPKQLALWQYLSRVDQATPGQISKEIQVARMTVSQALTKLLGLGLIVRLGQGRTTSYRRRVR